MKSLGDGIGKTRNRIPMNSGKSDIKSNLSGVEQNGNSIPRKLLIEQNGASGRTRTGTGLLPQDFESSKSTNFITEALLYIDSESDLNEIFIRQTSIFFTNGLFRAVKSLSM